MMLATSLEVINLEVQYGDHLERSPPCHGHWQNDHLLDTPGLLEHNPEIEWSSGKVCHEQVLAACMPMPLAAILTGRASARLDTSADNWKAPKNEVISEVHIEEVPEGQKEPNKTEPPPGFVCPDPDDLIEVTDFSYTSLNGTSKRSRPLR